MEPSTMRTVPGPRGAGWVALLASLAAAPAALGAPGHGNSGATITASFADSCRDFTAHSSKDISYVEFHYVDGAVVKDETINRPDYAVDGGPGGEIDFTRVKSGTTIEEFACEPANAAPTALLEIQTPPVDQTFGHCYEATGTLIALVCEQSAPRTAWTNNSQVPVVSDTEPGVFYWGCGFFTPPSQCGMTMTFRGTGSTDPDGDIASWSLDFGDGTSVSGTWSAPPAAVTHLYVPSNESPLGCVRGDFVDGLCRVTLTVTDSAGQTDSQTLIMGVIGQNLD